MGELGDESDSCAGGAAYTLAGTEGQEMRLAKLRAGREVSEGLMSDELAEALERWSAVALEQKWVPEWKPGAIFPREMVFFLAACEVAGVVNIVESGRQDAYSTELIGLYAQMCGGLAHSIDFEPDRARAEECRRRLAGQPNLVLLKGHSIAFFGPILMGDRGKPTAVLVDGPKGYLAISMLLGASGFDWVRLGAVHNLNPGTAEREAFVRLSPGPHFYEEVRHRIGGNWSALEAEEKATYGGRQEGRSVDQSTLGIFRFATLTRTRLVMMMSPRFGMWQPLRFFLKWRLANRL